MNERIRLPIMVIMLGALLALVSGGFAKNLAYQSQKAIDTLATTVAQRASQLFSANSTSLNADISVPKPVEPGKTVLTSTKPERKAPKKSIAPIPSKATAPAIQGEEDALFAMEDGLETDSPLPTEIKMVSLSEESSCEFSIQTHRAENRYRFFVRLPSVPVMVLTQP